MSSTSSEFNIKMESTIKLEPEMLLLSNGFRSLKDETGDEEDSVVACSTDETSTDTESFICIPFPLAVTNEDSGHEGSPDDLWNGKFSNSDIIIEKIVFPGDRESDHSLNEGRKESQEDEVCFIEERVCKGHWRDANGRVARTRCTCCFRCSVCGTSILRRRDFLRHVESHVAERRADRLRILLRRVPLDRSVQPAHAAQTASKGSAERSHRPVANARMSQGRRSVIVEDEEDGESTEPEPDIPLQTQLSTQGADRTLPPPRVCKDTSILTKLKEVRVVLRRVDFPLQANPGVPKLRVPNGAKTSEKTRGKKSQYHNLGEARDHPSCMSPAIAIASTIVGGDKDKVPTQPLSPAQVEDLAERKAHAQSGAGGRVLRKSLATKCRTCISEFSREGTISKTPHLSHGQTEESLEKEQFHSQRRTNQVVLGDCISVDKTVIGGCSVPKEKYVPQRQGESQPTGSGRKAPKRPAGNDCAVADAVGNRKILPKARLVSRKGSLKRTVQGQNFQPVGIARPNEKDPKKAQPQLQTKTSGVIGSRKRRTGDNRVTPPRPEEEEHPMNEGLGESKEEGLKKAQLHTKTIGVIGSRKRRTDDNRVTPPRPEEEEHPMNEGLGESKEEGLKKAQSQLHTKTTGVIGSRKRRTGDNRVTASEQTSLDLNKITDATEHLADNGEVAPKAQPQSLGYFFSGRRKSPACNRLASSSADATAKRENTSLDQGDTGKCVIRTGGGSRTPKTADSPLKKLQTRLQTHMQADEENNIYRCSFCKATFPDMEALRPHVESHRYWEETFYCDICQRRFSARAYLALHMNAHKQEAEKPFACGQCDRRFALRSYLAMHVRSHVKPFGCGACGKRFSRGDLLHVHVRSHTKGAAGKRRRKAQ